MNKKLIVGVSVAVICILVTTFICLYSFRSKTEVTLYISPQIVKGTVGQIVKINISISNVADLYGWQVKLEWNPQVLNFSTAAEGTFLKNHGQTFFSQKFSESGSLILVCTLEGDVRGASGSGTLATVEFYVKGNGTSELKLSETLLVNSSEGLIPHAVKNSQFTT